MKTGPRFLLIAPLLFLGANIYAQKTYTIIPQKTGKVDKTRVAGLSPALKALAAYYSALGGTDCIELTCELTSALGLGNQGSAAQVNLIKKYFPGDKAAILVLGQNCYLPPSTSASFSNFKSLSFTVNGEIVQVNYQLLVYEHGNSKIISGPDVFSFKNQVFKNKKRVLYAWVDK
jgi:hypothetical protein